MLFSTAGSRDTINTLAAHKRNLITDKLKHMGPKLRIALKTEFTKIKDTTPI